MTHRFDRSRLDEIDEALPVPHVAFPGRKEVTLLRRTLKKVRELLKRRGPATAGPATEPDPKPASQASQPSKAPPARPTRTAPG